MNSKKILVIFILSSIIFSRKILSNEIYIKSAYFCEKNGILSCRMNLSLINNYYDKKIYFFTKINNFNTRSFAMDELYVESSKNYGYEVGFGYNLLTLDKNNFYIIPSYYKTISYREELHFTSIDDIYNKVNMKLTYTYDNNVFSMDIIYKKFFNSHKDALEFNIEKILRKTNYFSNYIGYTYNKDIRTTNEYYYIYNNIKYNLLQMDNLLDRRQTYYFKMKINFSDSFNTVCNISYIISDIHGKYYSYRFNFEFNQ
jgi:hypothetical protein